ncbi:unnamed protein product [Soboliphyme baturini]|uniref:Uncharacterized protein n=1 Tax=Soboliphyme baturini TaxID=241478 RepID=A0A183ICK4_9BILA|nr:unnamed protein product [Soboliphyme baturini]
MKDIVDIHRTMSENEQVESDFAVEQQALKNFPSAEKRKTPPLLKEVGFSADVDEVGGGGWALGGRFKELSRVESGRFRRRTDSPTNQMTGLRHGGLTTLFNGFDRRRAKPALSERTNPLRRDRPSFPAFNRHGQAHRAITRVDKRDM